MSIAKYIRPRLCSLCKGPVLDGGVQVNKPQLFKMSRWWKAHFDADFEMKMCTVCHFCVWDLRFVDENSDNDKEAEELKWWPKSHKRQQILLNYKYYLDDLIKPCSVKMVTLTDKILEENGIEDFKRRFKCLHCPRTYKTVDDLFKHVKAIHPEEAINCSQRELKKLFAQQPPKVKTTPFFKCFYCSWTCRNAGTYNSHLYVKHKGEMIKCKCRSKFCKALFKTEEERDEHFEKHHNFGDFFCCFCNRNFKDPKAQLRHMYKYHKKVLRCSVHGCSNYFKSEEDRQKHVQEKHPEAGKFKCVYCLKTRSDIKTLKLHIHRQHKDVSIKCEFRNCFYYFKSEEEKQEHFEQMHEEIREKYKFFCFYCDKTIFTRTGFAGHIYRYHFQEEIIRCTYSNCKTYFKTEEQKATHIVEVHQDVAGKSFCVYCDKYFIQNIRGHVRKKHSDVAISCDKFHCGSFFKTLEDREKHMKEKHSKVEKTRKAVACLFCDKIFLGETHLREHIIRKHLDVAIKCQFPHCGQFFKCSTDLEKHFSSKPHHKEPPKKKIKRTFHCSFCIKTSSNKYDLQKHIKTAHLGRKKEVCPHCETPIRNLSIHIVSDNCQFCKRKVHCLGLLKEHRSNCRPKCVVCSKAFRGQSFLKAHCLAMHKVQWHGLQYKSRGFKCDECFVYFQYAGSLRKHKIYKHTDKSKSMCDFCKIGIFAQL